MEKTVVGHGHHQGLLMTSPVSRGHSQHLESQDEQSQLFLIGTVTNSAFVFARNRCHRHMTIVVAL